MSLSDWLLFCSITLAATLSPGAAILLVVSVSMRFGPAQCIATICGNITGLLIMSALSVAGVSYLILRSETAFLIIEAIGAIYLIYLGIKAWNTTFSIRSDDDHSSSTTTPSTSSRYLQGVLIALTNPKAIVFTTALFPQFINADAPLAPQFTILVVTFMALSALCLSGYAVLAAHLTSGKSRFRNNRLFNRLFGGAFVGAGLALALASNK